jgi:serine/threonine protein kinase
MTLAPGSTLGRYQILGPLGQGGMAVVYKAFQPALERTVALKVIRRGFAEDHEFRDRFTREARAIARLDHPNIVDVFDFDEAEGQVFLAMQYVEGGTLKDRLAALAARGERMPQEETAAIIGQVASALAYAHARGVVHRDVKPSNVMLGEDGSAVVTDFGIAKIVGGTQHTATGVGIGTPEYMSPEQGQGQTLDGRTDEYALAVTAYEMLTGTLPYTADTPFAVVLKHVRDPLPLPSKMAPEISARTEQVLLRALAKDPADRYPTVSEFAEELSRAIAERPGRTLPTVVTPRAAVAPTERVAPAAPSLLMRPIALAAAGIALLLLGGGSAAVLGAFATSTPTPTATPFVAVVTTPPPTTAPPTTAAPATTAPPTPTPTASPTSTARPVTSPPVVVVTTPPPEPRPQWTFVVNVDGCCNGKIESASGSGQIRVIPPGTNYNQSVRLDVGQAPGALNLINTSDPLSNGIGITAWPGQVQCRDFRGGVVGRALRGYRFLGAVQCTFGAFDAPGERWLIVQFYPNSLGGTDGDPVITFTKPAPCPEILTPQRSSVGDQFCTSPVPAGALTVTWDAYPGAADYCRSFRDETVGPTYQGQGCAGSTQYQTPALVAGHKYNVTIYAYDASNRQLAFGSLTFTAGP